MYHSSTWGVLLSLPFWAFLDLGLVGPLDFGLWAMDGLRVFLEVGSSLFWGPIRLLGHNGLLLFIVWALDCHFGFWDFYAFWSGRRIFGLLG